MLFVFGKLPAAFLQRRKRCGSVKLAAALGHIEPEFFAEIYA